MISFGRYSTILLLGASHGLVVAALLLRTKTNRAANACLAALVVSLVLMITPYILGYAGFYDVYPWLSFTPVYVTLLQFLMGHPFTRNKALLQKLIHFGDLQQYIETWGDPRRSSKHPKRTSLARAMVGTAANR